MASKPLRFTGSQGATLAALVDLPMDERPLAWAIFAHCFTCSKNFKVAYHIARALNRQRIAVLRFDFAGLGESEGDFSASNFSSNVGDLVAAADYLAEHFGAPQLLIGHSLGGAAVLAAAGRIDSVRAVVTIGAPYDPAHVAEQLGPARETILNRGEAEVELAGRHFHLRRQLLDDLTAQHPAATIAGLHKPLLIMHSPRDEIVGIDNAARIYQTAKHPKSFISLDDADHLLSETRDSRYAGQLIAAWARRYLDREADSSSMAEAADGRVSARTGAEGLMTELFANGHALIADEPKAYGGTDRGPSPYEYLLAALGACTGMTLQLYARKKHWPLENVVVRLAHEKIHARDCDDCETVEGKLDRIERELELQGPLSEDQRRRLLEIAERCPVHKTLQSEVQVTTELRHAKEEP